MGATQFSSNFENSDCEMKYISGKTVTSVKYFFSSTISFQFKILSRGFMAEWKKNRGPISKATPSQSSRKSFRPPPSNM